MKIRYSATKDENTAGKMVEIERILLWLAAARENFRRWYPLVEPEILGGWQRVHGRVRCGGARRGRARGGGGAHCRRVSARFHPGKATETLCKWVFTGRTFVGDETERRTGGGYSVGLRGEGCCVESVCRSSRAPSSRAAGSAKRPDHFYRN